MRAFILHTKNDMPYSYSAALAWYGFQMLGIECVKFYKYEDLDELYHSRNDILIAGVGTIIKRLEYFGITVDTIDYPDELKNYLGRDIWKSTINTISNHSEQWPVFVKSVEQKLLTGKVINSITDLVGCGNTDGDFNVYCSDVVNMVAEWRLYIRYGKVLDAKKYKGEWYHQFNPAIVNDILNDYTTAPNAYSLDIALTDKGETILVEVNDGFALGNYGLQPILYAKFLITRWCQLVDILDDYWYI